MKIIEIQNHKVYVDDEDFHKIKNKKLIVEKNRRKYVVRVEVNNVRMMLHKVIFGKKLGNKRVRFKDDNFLNCCKDNMVIITDAIKKESLRIYHVENVDKNSKKSKIYYRKNRTKTLAYQKRYSIENRERQNQLKNEHRRTFGSKWSELKRTAKRNHPGKPFDITKDKYKEIVLQGCFYCGEDLGTYVGTSLDRIDNSLGYELKNVIPCCGRCNRTRCDNWTVEETKVMITAALKFRKKQK